MKMKKKWKVEFSEEALKKVEDMPDKVYEKFEKIIKGLKTGKLDPKKIGKPTKLVELKTKLKCPECKSNEVEWLLDKNSNEVTFHCLKCSECFWMTYKEYKDAIKRNPDKIVS
jgi:ribosomal protein L33